MQKSPAGTASGAFSLPFKTQITGYAMPLKLHRFLQALAALAFLLFGLGIVNTMVSLKYEIKDDECISVVTGHDLCQALHQNWISLGVAVATIVALAFVRIKPVKPTS